MSGQHLLEFVVKNGKDCVKFEAILKLWGSKVENKQINSSTMGSMGEGEILHKYIWVQEKNTVLGWADKP